MLGLPVLKPMLGMAMVMPRWLLLTLVFGVLGLGLVVQL